MTDDDLESWLQTDIDPQLRDALEELKRIRAERLRDQIIALRDAWKPFSNREYPAGAFISDLDEILGLSK